MAAEDKESFVRWQGITRDYFSSVSNLVLGLSTGLLAFLVSGFVVVQPVSSCLLIIATCSMVLLAISIGLSVWCAINRLRDFRATTQIARSRYKDEPVSSSDRQETKALGKLSWCLFWWQLVLFGMGSCGVAITIIVQMWL
ncbi:hypothetical protein [Cellvibrio japonicus]|uniref:hypothetical protein n=1 Tax=Cellvibrio japonicus TaxID=155077 RepID=UPI0011D08BDA|nr:hypothetical protein [Cellvibrio japonicus]QEI13464.1 hypothetical protein FY117_15350 [Cellvibrio japonicus]QEI17038.1 hypothetical protein FY116_15355 [Cellvibrio japonicus]QEI20616.1 hypothetical protein FY115_15350 [Cellvibrio japonicus]